MSIRGCALNSAAFRSLFDIYANREKAPAAFRKNGGKVVGQLGCDVPDELIIAAGMLPVRLFADAGRPLFQADKYLEYSFDPVMRAQFEKLVDGTYQDKIDYLAISNSTDVIIRLYLYLREIKRGDPRSPIPPMEFIDWLFTRRMIHMARNEQTVSIFWQKLEEWSGRRVTAEDVAKAAAVCNEDRAALRRISALRKSDKVRISGSEALVIIGSAFFMDRREHAGLAGRVADEALSWPEIRAPRIFMTGSAQESTELYDLVEKAGGVVIGEDHDWGDRFFDRDYNYAYSAVRAIADLYMLREFSSKKATVSQRVKALDGAVDSSRADGVLFYINEYEEAASWDFPSQKKSLENRGIATGAFVKMRHPPSDNPALEERLKAFIESLRGWEQE